MYRRYLGVLASGGARKGNPARAAYDALRESLSGENVAARFYINRLRAFLDWIERFFGDVDMADHTLFPRAFGLKTPAPLWTAPAFDRCLLVALIYPIATIFSIWAVTGHAGPAEGAFGLLPGTSIWYRAGAFALLCFSLYAFSQLRRARSAAKRFLWFFVGIGVAVAGGAVGAGYIAIAVAAAAIAAARLSSIAGVGAAAVGGAVGGAIAVGAGGDVAVAAIVGLGVGALNRYAIGGFNLI
jgi:hypothetical protein